MEPEAGGGGAGGAPFPQDVRRGSGHPEQTPQTQGGSRGSGVGGGGPLGAFCVQALCVYCLICFF